MKIIFALILLIEIFWITTLNSRNGIYNIILFIIYGFWAIYFYKKWKKQNM